MRGTIVVILAQLVSLMAWAQQDEAEVRKLLSITQDYVRNERVKTLVQPPAPGGALSLLTSNQVYFSPHQSWDVDFSPAVSIDSVVRMTTEEPNSKPRDTVRFHFVVTGVSDDAAVVEIREADQSKKFAPAIDHVVLKIDRHFVLQSSTTHYSDANRPPTKLVFNGDRNVSLGFDAYPLALPDRREPQMSDLYGRSIQVVWPEGDVWPSYVKTASGVAVMVRK